MGPSPQDGKTFCASLKWWKRFAPPFSSLKVKLHSCVKKNYVPVPQNLWSPPPPLQHWGGGGGMSSFTLMKRGAGANKVLAMLKGSTTSFGVVSMR